MEHLCPGVIIDAITCTNAEFKAAVSTLPLTAVASLKASRRQFKQQIRDRKTRALYETNSGAVAAVMNFEFN